jgi:hypothetical protein
MASSAERKMLVQHSIANLVAGIAQGVPGVVHTVLQTVHNLVQCVVMVLSFVLSVGHGRNASGKQRIRCSPTAMPLATDFVWSQTASNGNQGSYPAAFRTQNSLRTSIH